MELTNIFQMGLLIRFFIDYHTVIKMVEYLQFKWENILVSAFLVSLNFIPKYINQVDSIRRMFRPCSMLIRLRLTHGSTLFNFFEPVRPMI